MEPEFMSDAIDDLHGIAPLSVVSSSVVPPTPIETDPGFLALVDWHTMVIDQQYAAAFMRGVALAQGLAQARGADMKTLGPRSGIKRTTMRNAAERRPYVAVPGAGKALRHSLYQTGVL